MADPIFKRESRNDSDEQVNLDLSDMRLAELKKELLQAPSVLEEEKNRGIIGRISIVMIALALLLLPFCGGLIAVFASLAQAQAYATIVTTLLDAVARVASIFIWPVMAYYFVRYNRKS